MAFLTKAHPMAGVGGDPERTLYHVITGVWVKKVVSTDYTYTDGIESGYYCLAEISVFESEEERDKNMPVMYIIRSNISNPFSETNIFCKIPDVNIPTNIIQLLYTEMRKTELYATATEV